MAVGPQDLVGGLAHEERADAHISYGVLAMRPGSVMPYSVVKITDGRREWCHWARSVMHAKSIIGTLVATHRAIDAVPMHRRVAR